MNGSVGSEVEGSAGGDDRKESDFLEELGRHFVACLAHEEVHVVESLSGRVEILSMRRPIFVLAGGAFGFDGQEVKCSVTVFFVRGFRAHDVSEVAQIVQLENGRISEALKATARSGFGLGMRLVSSLFRWGIEEAQAQVDSQV